VKNKIVFAFLVLLLTALAGAPGAWATGIATDTVTVSTEASAPEVKSFIKHWKHVAGNPFRGSDERAWRQHGLSKAEVVEMRQLVGEKKFEWATFSRGDEFSSVSFGKNAIWGKTVADWKADKAYAARLYRLSTGKSIAQVLQCHNWAIPEEEPIPSEIPPTEAPVPVPVPPKEKEVANYASLDWEFNGGVYGYGNKVVHGGGGYADGSLLFDAGSGLRIGPGFAANGTGGELNDKKYNWKRPWDIGPQLTVAYASGNSGVVSKTRAFFHSGYYEGSSDHTSFFGQEGGMLNQYVEYYRRPSKDFKWGAVVDINVQFDQHVTSSSSPYADPKDLGSFYVGAYAQRWVSPEWAIRARFGLRHENIISEWSLKPELTARYKETVFAGPGLNIPLNGHAVTYEAVAGVELHGTIQKAYRKAHGKVVRVGTVSSYSSGNNAGSGKDMPISFGVKIQ
jgi:hypothetical protein